MRHHSSLHNSVHPLSDDEAEYTKRHQASGDAEEPVEVFDVLTWYYTLRVLALARNKEKEDYIPVHAPDTGDDVHGQDNRTKDSQLAQDI